MLSLVFIVLGLLCGWLAWDAWRLRGGVRLPYSEPVKLYGQSADHLPLAKREDLQRGHERYVGKTDAMFLVFAIAAFGFLAGAVSLQLG